MNGRWQFALDRLWRLNRVHAWPETSRAPGSQSLVGDKDSRGSRAYEVRSEAVRDELRFSDHVRECLRQSLREAAWKPAI